MNFWPLAYQYASDEKRGSYYNHDTFMFSIERLMAVAKSNESNDQKYKADANFAAYRS